MSEGVDYSWARPGGAALAAAGKAFAVRYLSAGGGKGLTNGELADLHAHGIAVPFVYESGGQEALGGFAAGVASATAAQAEAVALGAAGQPIYFATDWDVTTGEYAAVDAYLAGAASVIGAGRVGLYGHADLMDHARTGGHAAWLWQTYAWSGGRVADGIHLLQYSNGQNVSGSVDLCRSYQNDYGQGGASTASLAPTALPTPDAPLTLGDTMIRIQSDNRGIALIGPGYFRGLRSTEEVIASEVLMEKHLTGHDRQFDLWASMALGGVVPEIDTASVALIAAAVK